MRPRYSVCWCGRPPLPGRATCSDEHARQATKGKRRRRFTRQCGCGMLARPKKATCSEECRLSYAAKPKACPVCSVLYFGARKYCSDECLASVRLDRRQDRLKRECVWCRKLWVTSDRKTCSYWCHMRLRARLVMQRSTVGCRSESHRARRRGERKRRFKGDRAATLAELVALQRGHCAVCGALGGSLGNGYIGLVLDHCHVTGLARQALCTPCNVAVGCVREDPSVAEALLVYVTACMHLKCR